MNLHSFKFWLRLTAMGALWVCCLSASGQTKVSSDHPKKMQDGLTLFRKDIRKILTDKCLKCHNQKSKKADFDLSTRQTLFASGMVEDRAVDSRLVELIRHIDEPHMPMKEAPLPDASIAKIEQWIDLGAPYDRPLGDVTDPQGSNADGAVGIAVSDADRDFWSFRPLRSTPPTQPEKSEWETNEIDRYVFASLQKQGLKPNERADRRSLIRRAYFGLLGLPPDPNEVIAFEKSTDPLAYEKMVDRLLDSKHYGERWARHWLDVARFAESGGFEHDDNRPNAYHYRDFVIKAFNADMPFDQFLSWQIAGDELAPEDPQALAATGFLGAGVFPSQITEVEFESSRYDELDDMVATTGVAFLGLSVGCARCHDHKFDPISSREYYQLVATFGKTIRSEVEVTLEPTTPPVKILVSSEGLPHVKNHSDGRGYPHYYPHVHLLKRGDVHQKVEVVEPNFLSVLVRNQSSKKTFEVEPPAGWARTKFQRASLANWMTDPESGAGHLAARVIVNRLWLHHFGQGIVSTPNDFGMQGERPTHPELLDYLAADLIDHGWKLKRLHKLIMLSATYTQGSKIDGANGAKDPENQFYWRHSPRRLEAEAIRDALLTVSGTLDRTMFGPSSLDEKMTRRSIYFMIKRSQLIPTMMLFDWPEHLGSIGRRAQTTTAPQALLLMNSELGRTFADRFSKRIAGSVVSKDDQQDFGSAVEKAYVLAFGRPAKRHEMDAAIVFIERQAKFHETEKDPWKKGLVDFCQVLLSSNEFVFIN